MCGRTYSGIRSCVVSTHMGITMLKDRQIWFRYFNLYERNQRINEYNV